ncbi:MAG TPA: hypothetical protein VF485_16885 [Sphingomonas sp.]
MIIASLLVAIATAHTNQSGLPWRTYANDRFAFQICYPSAVFRIGPSPGNDDGRSFDTLDGANLAVFGSYFNADSGIEKERAEDERAVQGVIKYRAAGTDWFAFSGSYKSRIFYQKSILRDGRFVTLAFNYPSSLAAKYDPIVRKIVGCLRTVRPAF